MAKVIDIRRSLPRHKKRKWAKRDNVSRIIVHTTASNNQDPYKTAHYHITPGPQNHLSKRGAPGIAYHDFITKAGEVYHCNDYQDSTWHCGVWNKSSVGVCMAFRGQDNVSPTPQQAKALEEHLTILCLYLKILPKRIRGHREVPGMVTILGNGSKKWKKTCPGLAVDLDKLRRDVTLRLQRRLSAENLYKGRIDGIFGPKSRAALRAHVPCGIRARRFGVR